MEGNVAYREWLRQWLQEKNGLIKEATYANYTTAILNHIIPALGDYSVAEITEEILQKTVSEWLCSGRLDHTGGLSKKTVRDLITIVKNSLRAADKRCGLPQREFALYFPHGGETERPRIFSHKDEKRLIQAALAENTCQSVGLVLCLCTGLRIGELCALTWEDVDFKERVLRVTKTLQRIFQKDWNGAGESKVVITPPKTQNAQREIPLADALLPLLRTLCPENRSAYFLTGTEKYLEPHTYRSYYARFLKRYNIAYMHFHCLRHTFATRCIESGADYKTVSTLLGHASVRTTLAIYVHPQMELKRACVEGLGCFW